MLSKYFDSTKKRDFVEETHNAISTFLSCHHYAGARLINRRAHHFGSSLPALRQAFLRKGASKFVADSESVHFRVSWWVTAGPLSMIDRGELSLVPNDAGRVRFALSFWKSVIPIAIAVVVVFGIINAPFGMWGRVILPIVGFLWIVTPGYLFAVWRFSRFVRRTIR